MANDLITGFYFSVSVAGGSSGSDAAFREVSGLAKEMHVEEVVCGGENRFKYRLPTGVTFQNLVLKRGVISGKSALLDWCKDTLNGGLAVPITAKNVQVNLMNQDGQSCQSWSFVNAYPIKWSASDLNSEKNEIFIETIELAYQYFE
jgi:phage tail-like protein